MNIKAYLKERECTTRHRYMKLCRYISITKNKEKKLRAAAVAEELGVDLSDWVKLLGEC